MDDGYIPRRNAPKRERQKAGRLSYANATHLGEKLALGRAGDDFL